MTEQSNAAEQPRDELAELLSALSDGTLSDERFAELEQRLLDDPTERGRYAEYLLIHAQLQWRFSGDLRQNAPLTTAGAMQAEDDATSLAPPGTGHRRRWAVVGRRCRQWIGQPMPLSVLLAGLFLTIVLLSLALQTIPGWQESPEAVRLPQSQFAATLLYARDAQWAPHSLVDGEPPVDLTIGRELELLSGAVLVRFDSGAIAWLEGAVRFRPQGKNSVMLRQGSFTAHVPSSAVNFLVRTPTVEVRDLGTQFNVQVNGKETEVHVLSGRVEVCALTAAGVKASHTLRTGEAAQFGSSSKNGFHVQEKEMNRALFVGILAFAAGGSTATAATVPFSDDFESYAVGAGISGQWVADTGWSIEDESGNQVFVASADDGTRTLAASLDLAGANLVEEGFLMSTDFRINSATMPTDSTTSRVGFGALGGTALFPPAGDSTPRYLADFIVAAGSDVGRLRLNETAGDESFDFLSVGALAVNSGHEYTMSLQGAVVAGGMELTYTVSNLTTGEVESVSHLFATPLTGSHFGYRNSIARDSSVDFEFDNFSLTSLAPVPEPSTLGLVMPILVGLGVAAAYYRKRRYFNGTR